MYARRRRLPGDIVVEREGFRFNTRRASVLRSARCVYRAREQGATTSNSGLYWEESQRSYRAREACFAAENPCVTGIYAPDDGAPPEPHRVVGGLQESDQGFRHRALAGDSEVVDRTDGVERTREFVAESFLYCRLDARLVCTQAGEEDRQCRGLGPLDALGVVMGNGGAPGRFRQHVIDGIQGKAHRAHPHGRTVTPAVVGAGVLAQQPAIEAAALARAGIGTPVAAVGARVVAAAEQGLRGLPPSARYRC